MSIGVILLYYFPVSVLANKELVTALKNYDFEEAERLIAEGYDPNYVDDTGVTPSVAALASRNEVVANRLIENGSNAAMFFHDQTYLHLACALNMKSTARLLLKKFEESVRIPDVRGNSPLHIAARCGDEHLVKLLLSKGTLLDAANLKGETATHVAMKYGCRGVISTLLSAGASIRSIDVNRETLLHTAAARGMPHFVKYLIRSGIELEALNIVGERALHKAVSSGNPEVVKILLEAGANQEAFDNVDLRTPLHKAAVKADKRIGILLMRRKISMARDKRGCTAFDLNPRFKDIAILQIEAGADISASPEDLFRALWESSYKLYKNSEFETFHDSLIKVTENSVHIPDGETNIKDLIKIYQKHHLFALYRTLKSVYKKPEEISNFVSRNVAAADVIVAKMAGKSYLGLLPVELISKVLEKSHYCRWEIERSSFYLTIASFNTKENVNDAFTREEINAWFYNPQLILRDLLSL